LGFSFDVTLEGILAVIEKVNQHRNKDKNEICLALQLIDSFIFQWHKDFVRVFKKATGLEGKVLDKNDETFQTIFAFTHRIDYKRLANEYNSYLVDVLYQGYYPPGNYKFRDIIDQMGGIQNVSSLASNIGLFADRAYGNKMDWLKEGMEEERWTVSAEEISTTLTELGNFSEEVRRLTSAMRRNIDCPAAINEELYRQLSNK
jgi:hypothetical protein